MADKKLTAPAPMMLCLQGHTTPGGTYPAGTRLRADDPAVKARPTFWIAEDSTDEERHAVYVSRFPGVPYLPLAR